MTEQTAEQVAREVVDNMHDPAITAALAEVHFESGLSQTNRQWLVDSIAATIQSERASADRRVNEAYERAARMTYIVSRVIAAEIRAFKSPTPTGGERG